MHDPPLLWQGKGKLAISLNVPSVREVNRDLPIVGLMGTEQIVTWLKIDKLVRVY